MQPHNRAASPRPDGGDLIGFQVEAVGGRVGSVDDASGHLGEHLVVRVGRWPFARKVTVPAARVNCVDRIRRRLYLHGTRAEFRASPGPGDARSAVGGGPAGRRRRPPGRRRRG